MPLRNTNVLTVVHPRILRCGLGAMLCWLALALPAWSQSVWVSSELYGQIDVVLAQSASPEQKHAADIFVKYWKLTTGQDVTVSSAPA